MMMVYEVIGKVALYIIGTLLFGVVLDTIDDMGDWGTCFWAWLAGILVFLCLIIPPPQ